MQRFHWLWWIDLQMDALKKKKVVVVVGLILQVKADLVSWIQVYKMDDDDDDDDAEEEEDAIEMRVVVEW